MASGSSSSYGSSTFRPNPNIPIPNGSFYYPETSFLEGDVGKLIVGAGLTIDYPSGVISASGGGGGGAVNLVTGGLGISVAPTTGNVVVTNLGVIQITAGLGINISGSKTNYTISTPNNGTVTSITAGSGLTGGIITNVGTLAIDGNVVLLKSLYTAKGQILVSTAAGTVAPLSSSGFPNGYALVTDSTAPTGLKWNALPVSVQTVAGLAPITVTSGTNPVVSVSTATTTNSGATTLVDDLTTNDPTKALTAAQGYALQQQVTALTTSSGLTLAGTLDAATGNLLTVTSSGTAAGFNVGSPIPAAALANKDYFVITTTAGTYTPPGGSATVATQGDWFLSTGTAWSFLNVGFDAPSATTTVAGIVQLATNGQAIAGTNSSAALTPAAGAAAYIPLACLTTKGTLVSATAATTPTALAVGTDGQILTACASCASGLTWSSAGAAGIPCSAITAKGDVLTGTAANNPVSINVGADGTFLSANSSTPTGLSWETPPYIPCACVTGKGALITGPSAGSPTALPVGTDGQILFANSVAANGLSWCTPAYIPCAIVTAKGGVIGGSAAGTPVYQSPAPANGCLLASDSACASGLNWIAPPRNAAPTIFGLVQGFTCNSNGNAFLGQQAGILATSSASLTTAIGQSALGAVVPSSSCQDTFIGACTAASGSYTSGCNNVAVGYRSFWCLGAGADRNTAIGSEIYGSAPYTGVALTGDQNVIIGHGLRLPSPSGNCQLALGFCLDFPGNPSRYWLTGCSNGTIRPGYGIVDCDGATGTPKTPDAGSIMYSMGDGGVLWGLPPTASLFCRGGYYGCDLGTIGLAIGLNTANTAASNFVSGCFNDAVLVGPNSVCITNNLAGSTVVGSKVGNSTGGLDSLVDSTYIGTCVNYGSTALTLSQNTFVGACSGFENEGSCNTFFGFAAASALPYSGTNNTVIGWCAQPAAINSSNSITLGNNSITTIRAAVTSITSLSDARDKTNIQTLPLGIEFVKDLNPVTFQWQYREGNPVKDGQAEAGFIAQQLHEVQSKHGADYLGLVNIDNPDRYEATPGKLIPVLVKALQDITAAHERLRADFDAYRSSRP